MGAGGSGGTGNVEWVVESIALYGVDFVFGFVFRSKTDDKGRHGTRRERDRGEGRKVQPVGEAAYMRQ